MPSADILKRFIALVALSALAVGSAVTVLLSHALR